MQFFLAVDRKSKSQSWVCLYLSKTFCKQKRKGRAKFNYVHCYRYAQTKRVGCLETLPSSVSLSSRVLCGCHAVQDVAAAAFILLCSI